MPIARQGAYLIEPAESSASASAIKNRSHLRISTSQLCNWRPSCNRNWPKVSRLRFDGQFWFSRMRGSPGSVSPDQVGPASQAQTLAGHCPEIINVNKAITNGSVGCLVLGRSSVASARAISHHLNHLGNGIKWRLKKARIYIFII